MISAAGCNCAPLAWDDPASSAIAGGSIAAGVSATTKTLGVPVANTDARSTNAAFDKCYHDVATECAQSGAFDSM